ncbi:hypothetical protein BaRGS_00032149 [Batillaria attramentaria]|uniref:CCHC-type domain-containing protein n=1 Tax=Batillaria attramentaria TaxID=370345 RepID=A0ABD0JNG1_9CAEN
MSRQRTFERYLHDDEHQDLFRDVRRNLSRDGYRSQPRPNRRWPDFSPAPADRQAATTRQPFRHEEFGAEEEVSDGEMGEGRVPTVINSRRRQPHEGRSTEERESSYRRPESSQLKPEHYDGSDDFESYTDQFECCAHLGGCLGVEAKHDYQHLTFQLEQRFGSGSRHGIYWKTQFENKIRQPGESISAFTDELLLLTTKVYPHLDSYTQQHLVMQQFFKSLDPELRLKCIETNCQTLQEAEEIVDVYETVMQMKTPRNLKGGILMVQPENQPTLKNLPQNQDKPQRDYQKGECFCCKAPDHFLKDCAVYQKCKSMEEKWKEGWKTNQRRNFNPRAKAFNQQGN